MRGLDKFRTHFAGAEQQYVLIGGAACDVIMGAAGLPFRATRDLDIVLCVEAIDAAFGERMWAFINEGGYEQRQRSTGGKEFFQFLKPTDEAFPYMLEFFSRKPDAVVLQPGSRLTPIPLDDEVASLSAILIDEAYYALLTATRRVVDGLSVLDEGALIPFKARAYLDLKARADDGEAIDRDNIKKHRADVFRLLPLLAPERVIALSGSPRSDFERFLATVEADLEFTLPNRADRGEAVTRLRRAYGL